MAVVVEDFVRTNLEMVLVEMCQPFTWPYNLTKCREQSLASLPPSCIYLLYHGSPT